MNDSGLGRMRKHEQKWDRRFVELARHISGWSKDPSTKVGAVVINQDRIVRSIGYNGFPRGVDDCTARYDDREQKYPRIVHAEMNAILSMQRNAGSDFLTIYTTLPPCAECAKAIIQAGIQRVVSPQTFGAETMERWKKSMEVTASMFEEACIEFELI